MTSEEKRADYLMQVGSKAHWGAIAYPISALATNQPAWVALPIGLILFLIGHFSVSRALSIYKKFENT